MNEFVEDQELSWESIYLLGWYDESGKSYLTTWAGDLPMVQVVVTGCDGLNMPLWDAPIPTNAKLHPVPVGEDPQGYARKLGGYRAFGWNVLVKRKEPK